MWISPFLPKKSKYKLDLKFHFFAKISWLQHLELLKFGLQIFTTNT